MLNRIIAFSVHNKLIIGILVLILVAVGAYQATRLPIDAVPDITNNQVQVITVAPAYGATDIERLVTFPIEQANRNIAGIKEIRSFSRFGLSLVTIVFTDDTDVYWARQQVAERLQQIQDEIPRHIGTPVLGPVSTGLGEIYQYVVRPKKGYEATYDLMELRTIQDWIVRRQLLGVPGVAEVSSFGGKLKQFEIAVNPAKLSAYGITVADVFDAVEANNQNTGGAYIEKQATVLYIRTEGLLGSIEDINNISISKPGHPPLFLRDVANVQTGFATRYGALCYNNQGEVAGAIVMMLKGANSNQVISAVKERIAQVQQTLPEGVVIEPFLDRTKMVNNSISTVKRNLTEGALIVVFVLVLFLGNLRAGLLVASVIPLSMLFAVCMMNLFGVSGNLMSLGALDFGLIVDGAVIIVEAVMHRLHKTHRLQQPMQQHALNIDHTVKQSAGRMMNSAVFGQVIILIVYLPILSLEGIEGKMFKPMAQTVSFALIGAFLLSLTYIPMMSALVLRAQPLHKSNLSDRLVNRLSKAYRASLVRVLRVPAWVMAGVTVLFIASLMVLSQMGGEFIPTLEEGDFAVDTRVLPGSNLSTTIEYTQKASAILLKRFPEVEKVVTKIGSGEVPTDPMPMEASDLMVILKDKDEWTSAESFDELAEKMAAALEDVPGISTGFQYPVQMRFNELMTGARQDVVCKIFGENLDTLAHYAAQLGKIANSVPGHDAVYVEPVTGLPQLLITYNRQMLAQYKLDVAAVNRLVNTAFAGQVAGQLFQDEKRFDVVVRLAEDVRQNLDDVGDLLVPVPAGGQVPLRQLATVAIVNGPNQVQREDARRRITVGFNVKDRDVQSTVDDLQARVSKTLKLPPGYYITYGGSFQNLQEGKARLMVAVPVALALIFLLLYFAFGSVKHSLLIYSAIPLSAIGGILFLALRAMPFSISAGIGFIALFGVAVLNGIVLIAEFNRLKQQQLSLPRVVLTGGQHRLRPVLMTAMVASLGFLPMSLSQGAGAEVQRPLATVVIGGLLVATFLTLYVLPILYILFEKGIKRNPMVKKATVAGLVALLAGSSAMAQPSISLDSALTLAGANNRTLKSERLRAEYAKAQVASARDMPKTGFTAEVGQFNSIYNDTRLGITQAWMPGSYYNSQRQVYQQQFELAVLNTQLTGWQINKAVSYAYYHYQYLHQQRSLLRWADTLFTNFYNKATLRLQKGESNILEKATAENQKAMVAMELRGIEQQLQVTGLQFNLLLNADTLYVPATASAAVQTPLLADSAALANNPLLALLQQQQQVSAAQTALEQAKLKPEWFAGYFNSSIRGIGADDKLYNAGSRFHSAQVGISVPIFAKAQKAKIKAAQLAEGVARADYEAQLALLQNQYSQLLAAYNAQTDVVQYYRQTGLANAQAIVQTANQQFTAGDINYLDWVNVVRQAIDIRRQYVEALRALNQTIISINYLQTR